MRRMTRRTLKGNILSYILSWKMIDISLESWINVVFIYIYITLHTFHSWFFFATKNNVFFRSFPAIPLVTSRHRPSSKNVFTFIGGGKFIKPQKLDNPVNPWWCSWLIRFHFFTYIKKFYSNHNLPPCTLSLGAKKVLSFQ